MEELTMLPLLRKSMLLPNLEEEFFGRSLMDNLFDNPVGSQVPAVNIIETDDSFRIEVAAPGLKKEEFKIDLENNVLTISSEKEEKANEKNEKLLRREFCYTCFKRSFALPMTVDTAKITASHRDGILYVEIPKREEAKQKPARQIEIS